MRIILSILLSLICLFSSGQDTPKNFVGMQFGGQGIVGYSYDRIIVSKNKFALNASIGFVVNEFGDDQDSTSRPIYGLNLGIIGLYDLEYLFLEAGIYPSPYFHKSLTFVNYYSWLGVRFSPRENSGGFISLGWTPSLYFSKPPPQVYNNVKIGVKVGFNF